MLTFLKANKATVVKDTEPLPVSGSVTASIAGTVTTQQDGASDGLVTTASATSATTVVTLNMTGYAGGSFQITGIGSGNTVTFEQSNDNSTWVNLPCDNASGVSTAQSVTATAVGLYSFVATAAYVRARVSTYGSGTVAISAVQKRIRPVPDQVTTTVLGSNASPVFVGALYNSAGQTETTTPLAGSATYTGTGRTTLAFNHCTQFKARAFADAAGTLSIEQTVDNGVTWFNVASVAMSANVGATLVVDIIGGNGAAHQYRAKVVNGASAQTSFKLISGYGA